MHAILPVLQKNSAARELTPRRRKRITSENWRPNKQNIDIRTYISNSVKNIKSLHKIKLLSMPKTNVHKASDRSPRKQQDGTLGYISKIKNIHCIWFP